MDRIKVKIKEEFIKLDSLLKLAGVVSTGGHAKMVILGGEVTVNNEVCLMRGKKIRRGDTVKFSGKEIEIDNEG